MEKTVQPSIWYALIASFYSKKLYQDVLQHWRKKLFLYVLILILILLIPFSIRFILNAKYVGSVLVSAMASRLPVVVIKDGVGSSRPSGVFYINYPGTSNQFGVIDMQGTYQGFPYDSAFFLINNREIEVKSQENKVKAYPYDKKANFTFGPEQLKAIIKKNVNIITLFLLLGIYTLGLVFAYLFFMIYTYFLGVFTTISATCFRVKLSFKENVRLTSIALTPGALILSFLYLFRWLSFPIITSLFVLQVFYTGFAVFSCKKTVEKINKEKKNA